jgi:hypothetical protein
MIEKGKAIVTVKNGDSRDLWKLVPFSETILQETADVFNLLVEEIETRLPKDNNHTPEATSPLIEEAILDTANSTRGFAYRFTQKWKRPSFRYIALGLEISDCFGCRRVAICIPPIRRQRSHCNLTYTSIPCDRWRVNVDITQVGRVSDVGVQQARGKRLNVQWSVQASLYTRET